MQHTIIKLTSKSIIFLIGCMLATVSALAQTNDSVDYVQPFSKGNAFRRWSIGINGGLLIPFKDDYRLTDYHQPGFGLTVKHQILSSFGIQADFFGGQARGYDSEDGKYRTYVSRVASAALSINVTLANINWRHKKGVIQPYFTAGYGYMGYRPQITTAGAGASGSTTTYYQTTANGIVKSYFVPVGAGLKFNVSRGINIDLGYTVSLVRADTFDGTVYGTGKDKFSYIHAGIEFSIGSHKKPQLATYNPVNSMRIEYLGIKNTLQIQIDAQKAQIEQLKTDLAIKDEQIKAANANLVKLTIDSDGDGVSDLYDKCPNTPVSIVVDGSGCPLVMTKQPDVKVYVTEQDKKVVKEAVDNLQFDFGKATIRPVSFETLDRLAKLLVEKGLSLRLSGYTDNVGPDAVNLKLSKQRAEAIKTYLVSKGANPSKIEANGYGKEDPIAPNNTVEGRALNRRVEFILN